VINFPLMKSATKLKDLVEKLGEYCTQMTGAPYFRAQVHMAEHVFDTLGDINLEVEHFLKSANHPAAGSKAGRPSRVPPRPATTQIVHPEHDEPHLKLKGQPFRKMTLAQAARELLAEHAVLHGKDIERLALEGGYRTASKNFQSTMVIAFQRDGGFENVGRNRWRLKQPSLNLNGGRNGAAGVEVAEEAPTK
jgi:hypothetical protein